MEVVRVTTTGRQILDKPTSIPTYGLNSIGLFDFSSNKISFRKMLSILKTIFFKLYLNLIGAVYLVKENVIRPRRLPDYPSQGESWSSD